MDLEQNTLVLNTGERLILFDLLRLDAGQAEVGYGLHSGGVLLSIARRIAMLSVMQA